MLLTLSLPIIALFTVNFILKKNKKNKKRCLKNSHNSLSWFSFYLVFLKFCINVVFKYFMEFFKKEIFPSESKNDVMKLTNTDSSNQSKCNCYTCASSLVGSLRWHTPVFKLATQAKCLDQPAQEKNNNNKQTTTLEFRCIFNTSQLVLSALISLKNNRINAATLR